MTDRLALTLVAISLTPFSVSSATEDNLVLRKILESQINQELARHDSEEAAWFNEKSVDRQRWTKGTILGRPVRLASWTEQSKSWVWLDGPPSATSIDIEHITVQDGRLEFAARASLQARFKVWGRIPKLVQASVGGTARVKLEIAGSTAVRGGGLTDSKITTFAIHFEDLQFNNDAAHVFEDLAKDALNDFAQRKNQRFSTSIERAIDRVRFSREQSEEPIIGR